MNSTIKRYKEKAINILTRPFSRSMEVYSTPEYEQKKKDEKNPKSPRYKKNLLDKVADRFMEGSTMMKNLGSWKKPE